MSLVTGLLGGFAGLPGGSDPHSGDTGEFETVTVDRGDVMGSDS